MGYKSVESDFCYIVFVFKYCFVQSRCMPIWNRVKFFSDLWFLPIGFKLLKDEVRLWFATKRFDHLVKKESNIMLFSSGLAAAPFPHRKSPFPSPRIHNICLLLFCSFFCQICECFHHKILYIFSLSSESYSTGCGVMRPPSLLPSHILLSFWTMIINKGMIINEDTWMIKTKGWSYLWTKGWL